MYKISAINVTLADLKCINDGIHVYNFNIENISILF